MPGVEFVWFALAVAVMGLLAWLGFRIEPHWVAKDRTRFICNAQLMTEHGEPVGRFRETKILVEPNGEMLVDQRRRFRRHMSAWRVVGESDDPLHHVPENSRRFRALPAWLTLAAYGRDGIAEWIVRNNALAQRLGDGIARLPAFELLDAVRLNIVCFALRDGDAASRDALLARLARDGRVYLTPTVLRGRPAIRAALVNWRTSQGDVEIALQALAEAART